MAVDDTVTQLPTGRRRIDFSSKDQAARDAALAKEAEDARLAKEAEDAALANEGVDLYSAPRATSVLMKAPADCAPVTLAGEEYVPDADGLVEIPAAHVAALTSHGFEIV